MVIPLFFTFAHIEEKFGWPVFWFDNNFTSWDHSYTFIFHFCLYSREIQSTCFQIWWNLMLAFSQILSGVFHLYITLFGVNRFFYIFFLVYRFIPGLMTMSFVSRPQVCQKHKPQIVSYKILSQRNVTADTGKDAQYVLCDWCVFKGTSTVVSGLAFELSEYLWHCSSCCCISP